MGGEQGEGFRRQDEGNHRGRGQRSGMTGIVRVSEAGTTGGF